MDTESASISWKFQIKLTFPVQTCYTISDRA